ncbi:MAG: saccharopine dehydrogenase NADP-binding domain-containing protein [Chitinophagales bacterium]|nr:saccharopine dehydrogenase NADP-binding domain-containing protein [Chitinophagales bacterium]
MSKRKYNIVVFGATGFTGSLVAEYLAKNATENNILWAIAGRNKNKLQAVKDKLIAINNNCKSLDILIADVDDYSSLLDVCKQTDAVVTTVGPFILYGENLVKACVEAKTHYCDITGEPEFVKNMYKKYNEQAKTNKVYIVNCCGFDSIPADAGAFYTAMQLPANEQKTIRGFVSTNASFSGGTFASALHAFSDVAKLTASNKASKKSTNDKPVNFQPLYFEKELKKWALTMPVIDNSIVAQTAKLRPTIFGKNFHYNQYLALKSLGQAIGITSVVSAMVIGAQLKFTRDLLLNYRKSGEGPSEQERNKYYFKVIFIGESETKKVMTKVSGGDPGYTETSKMLSETAMLIINQKDQLTLEGGVVTPSGLLGQLLIEKLNSKGIKFEILEQ